MWIRLKAGLGILSYSLILRGENRIYGLDMSREHRPYSDKCKHANGAIYDPDDITVPPTALTQVWEQFCREAS